MDEPTPTPVRLIPVNFKVTDATEETMSFSWETSSSLETKVRVEFSDKEDFSLLSGAGQWDDNEEIQNTTFVGLESATLYYCRIKSYTDVGGWGEWKTISASTTISAQSLVVESSYTDSDKPKLTWEHLDNEYTSVGVYRKLNEGFVKIMAVNKSDGNEFVDTSVVDDGTYQYKLNINNGFSGTFSDIYSVTIDTTPPGVPNPTTLTPTNNNKPTWNWDSVEPDVDYEVRIDAELVITTKNTNYTPSSPLSDGEHTISVTAIDSFGNKGETGSQLILIDTTPPTKPNVVINTTLITNNKKPTWTWPNDPDVKMYGIIFNDQEEIESTSTSFTPDVELSDGNYTLKVRAKDELDNWSAYGLKSLQIDATPPGAPEFTSGGGLTSENKPTWTWNSVIDAVEYGITLNSNIEILQSETTFTSPVELEDGINKLKVRAKDSVGNWSDYNEVTTVVDTTAPLKPQPTSITPTSNPRPSWTWPRTDDVQVYEVIVNDGNVSVITNNTYTPSVNFPTGKYTLRVRARDEIGNWSDWGEHTVDVDITIKAEPTSESPTSNKLPTWEWSDVTDAVSYGIILNSREEVIQTETSFTSPVTLSDGANTIKSRAKDNVGNWSEYGIHVVEIDTLPLVVPKVFSDSPFASIKRPTWKWDSISDANLYRVTLNEIETTGTLIQT